MFSLHRWLRSPKAQCPKTTSFHHDVRYVRIFRNFTHLWWLCHNMSYIIRTITCHILYKCFFLKDVHTSMICFIGLLCLSITQNQIVLSFLGHRRVEGIDLLRESLSWCWPPTGVLKNGAVKNISQLGWLFPIYGKIKFMFQTTNQFLVCFCATHVQMWASMGAFSTIHKEPVDNGGYKIGDDKAAFVPGENRVNMAQLGEVGAYPELSGRQMVLVYNVWRSADQSS